MRRVNPRVIPRNHRVEEALAAASDDGDLAPFERLLDALGRPYDEAGELAPYAEPAPAAVTARYQHVLRNLSQEKPPLAGDHVSAWMPAFLTAVVAERISAAGARTRTGTPPPPRPR